MDEAASSLALHVPRLRRFARALTGEQRSGDAYVAATLQALVADPSCMPAALSTRAGLFHVFLRVWNSLELNQVADRVPATTAVDRRLSAVTPLPRQAFLLFAMEDF
ncbi:MAG: response regulator, partial [Xanthobacteraceae bacterium]